MDIGVRKMRTSIAVFTALCVAFAQTVQANSYIEMITMPPPVVSAYAATQPPVSAMAPILVSAPVSAVPLPTPSPVVMPPHRKYAAWQKAQQEGMAYNFHEDVQNLILVSAPVSAVPLPTPSPIVMPPHRKYAAWQKAQQEGMAYNFHEDVQNLIYFLSGAAVARAAYDIWGPYHRHHIFDHW